MQVWVNVELACGHTVSGVGKGTGNADLKRRLCRPCAEQFPESEWRQNVLHSCGHVVWHEFNFKYGMGFPTEELERRRERPCLSCVRNERERTLEKNATSAVEWARERELVELQGTPRQVKIAHVYRRRFIELLESEPEKDWEQWLVKKLRVETRALLHSRDAELWVAVVSRATDTLDGDFGLPQIEAYVTHLIRSTRDADGYSVPIRTALGRDGWILAQPLHDITPGQRAVRRHAEELLGRDGDMDGPEGEAFFLQALRSDRAVVDDSVTGQTLDQTKAWPNAYLDYLRACSVTREGSSVERIDKLLYIRDCSLRAYTGGEKYPSTVSVIAALMEGRLISTFNWGLAFYEAEGLVAVSGGGCHRSLACMLAGYGDIRLPCTVYSGENGYDPELRSAILKVEGLWRSTDGFPRREYRWDDSGKSMFGEALKLKEVVTSTDEETLRSICQFIGHHWPNDPAYYNVATIQFLLGQLSEQQRRRWHLERQQKRLWTRLFPERCEAKVFEDFAEWMDLDEEHRDAAIKAYGATETHARGWSEISRRRTARIGESWQMF